MTQKTIKTEHIRIQLVTDRELAKVAGGWSAGVLAYLRANDQRQLCPHCQLPTSGTCLCTGQNNDWQL